MKASKASSITLTLVLLAAILVVVNYIVGGLGVLNLRADLTERKQYTLSEGTKRIVEGLNPDKPVSIRLYASRDSRLMPLDFQAYADTVRDLLLEYEKYSDGKITLEVIDPRPDTEEEDRAVADDIQGHQMTHDGSKVYLGLAVQCLQQKEIIPVLNPNDESSLEYSISRTLSRAIKTKQTKLGVMSALPLAGPAYNLPPMMMMGQQKAPPWILIQQLRQDYEVVEVSSSTDQIEPDIDLLLVIHPSDVSNKAQFAIDQFLLRGGKILAMVDPYCQVTQAYNNQAQMNPTGSMISPGSDLNILFPAWGVKYSPSLVVADMDLRTMSDGRALPTTLTMGPESLDRSDPAVAPLDKVQMFVAGAFDIQPKDGITATPLVRSSENSQMIDTGEAEKARTGALNSFTAEGKKRVLALRLNGKFTTAFPDGPPVDNMPQTPKMPGETGGATDDAGAPAQASAPVVPAPAEAKDAPAAPAYLKESQAEGIIYLFSDVDMVYDIFCFQSDRTGRIFPMMINANLPLILNSVETLVGGKDLIAVRSRAATDRTFTRMEKLRSEVESEYRPLIEQRNQELTDIVQQIADLGGTQQEDGVVVLNVNHEQREQLLEKQLSIQKDIRSLVKAQNSRKERLEMNITLLNFLIVPTLVVLVGIVLAVRRRSLQAAR